MTITSLEDMQTAIGDVLADALKPPLLVEARAWANEVGIRAIRSSQRDALQAHRTAQQAVRLAQAVEAEAQEGYDQAVSEAEWGLAGSFVTEGNRSFLIVRADDGEEPVRRQMTADEKRGWISGEAQKLPTVREAAAALRKAKDATASARDEVTHAGLRVSAAKHELDAAAAELTLLAAAIPHKETER